MTPQQKTLAAIAAFVAFGLIAGTNGEQPNQQRTEVDTSDVGNDAACSCQACQCCTCKPKAEPESKPKPEAEPLPVVTLYSADWCAQCLPAKAALKSAKWCELRIIDADTTPVPGGMIPYIEWSDSGGNKRSATGWSSQTLGKIKESIE